MKHASFRAVRLLVFLLVMLSVMVFSVFGDEKTIDYYAIVLDPFDGTTTHEWSYGGRTYNYEFEWHVDASKFATQEKDRAGNVTRVFPQKTVVSAWPMALYGINRENRDIKSFGIWGRFDRRGYNWVDVYPVKVGTVNNTDGPEPFEIPIPGRIQYMDLWVWGSNLNYYMEAYFRDYQGVVHTVRVGDIAYQGWKNLRVKIPASIPQSKRILPQLASLSFVKFRIWTTPLERVDNFYVYFNQFKILTDTFESLFDGNELTDPARIQELWAQD